ncbi:RNA recognition motif domain-containing protein [Catenovulum adriaticum]|uniref:RNA-binding protein n=1 Tax=Catenovulum adriaticum TaxID=2984846 RepID=A0ABY7ANB8_9ALTE|nr:RNA-binding protein [Catenovulum sp. TS8]WAJ69955.1 RNA-binding protein [Catenovulum sp. TS8]
MSNNNVFKQAFVVIFLTLVCFFVLPLTSFELSTHVALSLGLLIGGSVSILLSSTSTTAASSDTDETDIATKTIYVGNLPYRANEAAVRELFATHGQVTSVRLMRDRNTGKRKGFGFVEMAESAADKAISELNEQEFQQRTLKVREAKDRSKQSSENQ